MSAKSIHIREVLGNAKVSDADYRILLAANTIQDGEELNINRIAEVAGVARRQAKLALYRHLPLSEIPNGARTPTPSNNRTYDDLTDTQRRVVNEFIVNPGATEAEIARAAGCSQTFVSEVITVYGNIIEDRLAGLETAFLDLHNHDN